MNRNLCALVVILAVVTTIGVVVPYALATTGGSNTTSGTLPPNTYTDGGFTETTDDGAGHILAQHAGTLAQIPKPTAEITGTGVSPQACCSNHGCDSIDVYRTLHSWPFQTVIDRFHHIRRWCWTYPNHTYSEAHCYWTDANFVNNTPGCQAYGWWYTWHGSTTGGRFTFKQGHAQQCHLLFVCAAWDPWIKIWTNANGAWASEQGD